MYRNFYQKKKKFYKRFAVLIVIMVMIMAVFAVRISDIQVINASEYLAQADTTSTATIIETAPRGEIVDRYGRPLVTNEIIKNISFNAGELKYSELNETILKLTNLLTKNNEEWTDLLPISKNDSSKFTKDSDSDVAKMRRILSLAKYATAQNCYDAMVSRYSLEKYDAATQRRIMGVRYSMEAKDYSVANPFLFAEDVGNSTVTLIQESSFALTGVEVVDAMRRAYSDPTLCPHILGYTGLISDDEWERVKNTGEYQLNGKIGKSGIESAAEQYLKGVDGKMQVTRDSNGNIISKKVVRATKAGNTVQLTIDKNLQKVTQQALYNTINKKTSKGTDISGAAVVVMQVTTGEILAAANYPSYNINTLMKNYSQVLNAANRPLYNRAFMGLYHPGSTFKPAVGLIGLQTGVINVDSTIYCSHTYTRFKDYQPHCAGYHGSISVKTALSKSCNYFFFETAYRVGIRRLNAYCRQLGLGVKTGVELPESEGILAGPDYRESIGGYWQDGDTLQAGIGQSDNTFTPLQLAQYCSTIANGGTRYRAHLIKSVNDYSMSTVVKDDFTEKLNSIDISEKNMEIIKQGMQRVTEDGTASAVFKNYSIKVAGKTGTADEPNKKTNAVFISFAPYDDPEIAVAIVIENGGHGSTVSPIAKEIFNAYFFTSHNNYKQQKENTLLY